MLGYSRQTIEADDIQNVLAVLNSDFLTQGSQVEAFEKELAAYCGSRYAVVCSNGTAALHLACLALDLQKGEKVLTSPITFMATANCARYVGAEVEFVDIDPGNGCLSPDSLEACLRSPRRSEKPRAILPVHFGGAVADLAALYRIAKQAGLAVIEDACHALGATYLDETGTRIQVGSCRHSDMTVFSFHPVKQITTGEGGAITTNSTALYEKLTRLRSHGIVREPENWVDKSLGFEAGKPAPWYHEMQALGFNYRLTDIQSALGRSQLAKLDRFVSERQRLAGLYRTLLHETQSPARPLVAAGNPAVEGHSFHLFCVQIDFGAKLGRAELMRKLVEDGISAQVHYIPVYRQPYYQARYGLDPGAFPHAENYYRQALSIPLFPTLRDEDVHHVVQSLNRLL